MSDMQERDETIASERSSSEEDQAKVDFCSASVEPEGLDEFEVILSHSFAGVSYADASVQAEFDELVGLNGCPELELYKLRKANQTLQQEALGTQECYKESITALVLEKNELQICENQLTLKLEKADEIVSALVHAFEAQRQNQKRVQPESLNATVENGTCYGKVRKSVSRMSITVMPTVKEERDSNNNQAAVTDSNPDVGIQSQRRGSVKLLVSAFEDINKNTYKPSHFRRGTQ